MPPSSASSTTLERSSSVPTLTDGSPSPSFNSSRSSVLAEPPIAIAQCLRENDDSITGASSTTTVQACQQATVQLTVAKRLLSSAKFYSNNTDGLRAVKSFGDTIASLLCLRSSSPKYDASSYLGQSVIVHVSKILSSDLEIWLTSSSSSDPNPNGAYANFADLLIQALEGLQDSVYQVNGKSLFNAGPVLNEEKPFYELADPAPHAYYSNASRDQDEEDDTRPASSSQADNHLVNLTAESNLLQVTQEQPLIYAHAISSLLLNALSGLDESRLKSQVSSLASDVALKTPAILCTPRGAHIDPHSLPDQTHNNDDHFQNYITRPGHSPPVQRSPRPDFPTLPSTTLPPISTPSAPAFPMEKSHDHTSNDHVRLSSGATDIGRRNTRPNSHSFSSRPQRLHETHHPRYHPHRQHNAQSARPQSLLSLSLAFAPTTTTAPKAHDEAQLNDMMTTTTMTAAMNTTTAAANPANPPSPVATVRSARSMFSKFPARPHTLFSLSSFSSSDATTITPGKPTPTLKYDMTRKSRLVPAEVVPASTNAVASLVDGTNDGDEQAKWTPVRYRTISSPAPYGGRSSESSDRNESGDIVPTPRVGAKMNNAGARPYASQSAKDLLSVVQSRAGAVTVERGDAASSSGIMSRIRTRALSFAPSYYPFASSTSSLPSSHAYNKGGDPSTRWMSQNRNRAQTTSSYSSPPTRTPTLLVTSPSSSPTRPFYVSQILTPSTANNGRQTHPTPTTARRRSTGGSGGNGNNHPLPFRAHTLANGSTSSSAINRNGFSSSGGDSGGPMPPLHPALAAVERSSRLLRQSIRCAACGDAGKDFPRCGKCGEAWCSRDCRIKSLAGKKRHVCAVVTTPSPVDGSAPASASIATRNCSASIHTIPSVPTVPTVTPSTRPVDWIHPPRHLPAPAVPIHVMG